MHHIIIMGVAGSGKSTIGALLATKLNIPFFDGDDFHPKENVAKMASGQALTDHDRVAFLANINTKFRALETEKSGGIIACSALKATYRVTLNADLKQPILFVFLKGNKALIQQRLAARKGHFMPPALLDSQFETLEEPQNALTIDIDQNPENIIDAIMHQLKKSSFGLVGMGVMGTSLARNFARNGVALSLFNRRIDGKEENIALKAIDQYPELSDAGGFENLEDFVDSMACPRKIFLMIKAGADTDIFIDQIAPLLAVGDILIDGGNSHFEETKARIDRLAARNIHFVGTGVSGGEEGALNGPSIMPSGPKAALDQLLPLFNLIAAKDANGRPCCTAIGPDGSGHFVKTIHNGIEYAEMQLIAEIYGFFRFVCGYSPDAISSIFKNWCSTEANSYLLEISAKILQKTEGENSLIDLILDRAGNKGTGNWTTVIASELGQPATTLTAALYARYTSTLALDRADIHTPDLHAIDYQCVNMAFEAFVLARKINHFQGFELLKAASLKYQWHLNLTEIARIWTNGCIIRSTLMEQIAAIGLIDLESLHTTTHLKKLLSICVNSDLATPCLNAALDYVKSMVGPWPTANVIQAQRDFFGAHTFQRRKDPSGAFYHANWAD